MKILWKIVLFTILIACKPSGNEVAGKKDSTKAEVDTTNALSTDELHDSDYGIYQFPFSVHNTLPTYTLKFHLPNKKIYLYNEAAGEDGPFQEFNLSDDINYDEGYFAENAEASFDFSDCNFDGFKDLFIISIAGSGNTLSDVYIFDSSKNKFVKDQELSQKTSLEIDSVNQILKYHNSGGMGGGWYTAGIIRWKGGRPRCCKDGGAKF